LDDQTTGAILRASLEAEGSGCISLSLWQLTIDATKYAQLASVEKLRLQSKSRKGKGRARKIDEALRQSLHKKFSKTSKLKIEASEGQDYCDWLALILSAH